MIFKIAMDPAKGWQKEMLAPAAAAWYPPEFWPKNSLVFQSDSVFFLLFSLMVSKRKTPSEANENGYVVRQFLIERTICFLKKK